MDLIDINQYNQSSTTDKLRILNEINNGRAMFTIKKSGEYDDNDILDFLKGFTKP